MHDDTRKAPDIAEKEGREGFRYVTGHAPYASQDEVFREDQQRRIDAREGDPRDADEWEAEAASAWDGFEVDEGSLADVRDAFLVDEPEEAHPSRVNDPDVDTQGRVALEGSTRDWSGDAWADSGAPRLDDGE
jgi:hypothetical protein